MSKRHRNVLTQGDSLASNHPRILCPAWLEADVWVGSGHAHGNMVNRHREAVNCQQPFDSSHQNSLKSLNLPSQQFFVV